MPVGNRFQQFAPDLLKSLSFAYALGFQCLTNILI